MRTKSSLLKAAVAIFFTLILFSCFDKGDCFLTSTPVLKVNIYDATSRKTAKTVTFTSIHAPGKFQLYPAEGETSAALASFNLLLDPSLNQMKYVLKQATRSDTLVFDYNNETVVLSPDCGAYIYQKDISISHSTLGETGFAIKNNRLLSSATVNVEIFF